MRLLMVLVLASAAWGQGRHHIDKTSVELMPELSAEVRARCNAVIDAAGADYARLSRDKAPLDGFRERWRGKLRDETGLTSDQFERLCGMPVGRCREMRYNHSTVLEAPDLEPVQREFLTRLVAAVDAAQCALDVSSAHAQKALENAEPVLVRQATSRLQQQIQDSERRFWLAAYYALTPEQMRAVRKLLSPGYASIPQLREQMMALPGLTPSQASQIVAAFTEQESETAADEAEIRRCQAELRTTQPTPQERSELQARVERAGQRLGAINERLRERLQGLLNEEQLAALRATPPQVPLYERNRPAWEMTNAMALRQAQVDALQKLQQEGQTMRLALERQAQAETDGELGEFGSESPQQMMRVVSYRSVQGQLSEHYRDIGRRLVLELLDPHQVAEWVVSP